MDASQVNTRRRDWWRLFASYVALFALVLVPRGALSAWGLPAGFGF